MSGLLDSLPVLPDITGRSAYPVTNNSGVSGTAVNASASSVIGQAIAGALTNGMSASLIPQDGKLSSSGKSLSIQSIVFMVLGLLFIAGGIFAFREVRQTVVQGVKTGAKVAAAA